MQQTDSDGLFGCVSAAVVALVQSLNVLFLGTSEVFPDGFVPVVTGEPCYIMFLYYLVVRLSFAFLVRARSSAGRVDVVQRTHTSSGVTGVATEVILRATDSPSSPRRTARHEQRELSESERKRQYEEAFARLVETLRAERAMEERQRAEALIRKTKTRRAEEAREEAEALRKKQAEQEVRRKARETENDRRLKAKTEARRTGLHKARFHELSGNGIDVQLQLAPAKLPTVRDWRALLAEQHFLVPSFRWVVLFDDDGEVIEDDSAVLVFDEEEVAEAEEGVVDRIIHAGQKVLPPLVKDLSEATPEQLADRDVVLRSVEVDSFQFRAAPEQFRADKEIALFAVQNCWFGTAIQYVAGDLRHDRDVLMASLARNSVYARAGALRVMPPAMREDPEIISAALERSSWSSSPGLADHQETLLDLLPASYRSDEDAVLRAVFQNPCEWRFVAPDLAESISFARRAVAENGHLLQFLVEEPASCLRGDRAVVEQAIKSAAPWKSVLQHASAELQNDRELVRLQVKLYPEYLEVAQKTWQQDAEIVRIAIRRRPDMLKYVDPKVLDDRTFVEKQLKSARWPFEDWSDIVRSPALQQDRSLAVWALDNCEGSRYTDDTIFRRGDRGDLLRVLPTFWRSDAEICRKVFARHGGNLEWAVDSFRSDPDMVTAAIQNYGKALEHAAPELQRSRDIVLTAVQNNGLALAFASDSLRADKEIVLAAVRENGCALEFASVELKQDREVCIAAVQETPEAVHFVDDVLRMQDEEIKDAARQATHGKSISSFSFSVDSGSASETDTDACVQQ